MWSVALPKIARSLPGGVEFRDFRCGIAAHQPGIGPVNQRGGEDRLGIVFIFSATIGLSDIRRGACEYSRHQLQGHLPTEGAYYRTV